jgi:hypothetical protein
VLLVPTHLGDFRLEARPAVEIVLAADRAAVGEDLGRARVLLGRNVAELLEQRQVDVRLDVALRARIAIPVPRAAEVAAFSMMRTSSIPASRRRAAASNPPKPPPITATSTSSVSGARVNPGSTYGSSTKWAKASFTSRY